MFNLVQGQVEDPALFSGTGIHILNILRIRKAWVSSLHISHTSTFMQVLEQIVTLGLSFCNADCFIVNCVGLTPILSVAALDLLR